MNASTSTPEGLTLSLGLDFVPIWRSLLEQGLAVPAARRELVRIALKAAGIPERLRASPSSAGTWVVEAWEEGAWRALDLDPPAAAHDAGG